MITRIFGVLLSGCLILTGCGEVNDSASSNLVCAFVEGYLANKALALSSLSRGESASDNIEATIGVISSQVPDGTEARKIFDEFYSSMFNWGTQVDNGYAMEDSNAITSAAELLERNIDPIASQCEAQGWKFEKNWR